jgi:copper transport protein
VAGSIAVPRGRRLAVVLALAFVVVASWQRAASAHAVLVSSDPADGATLTHAPATVSLRFDDELSIARSSAQLVGADGAQVGPAQLLLAGDAPGRSTGDVLVITLPPLSDGAYQLRWRALDAVDFHATTGTLVFGVGQRAGAQAAVSDPWPRAVNAVATWLQLMSLTLVIGALGVAWLLLPALRAGPTARTTRRLTVLAAGSAVVSVVAGALVLAVKAADAGHLRISTVMDSSYGHGWIVAEAACVVLSALLLIELRRRGRPPVVVTASAAVLVVTVVVAQNMTSHLARAGGGSVTASVAATGHLLAAGLWVGALVSLAVVVPALLRSDERALAFGLLRSFAWLAIPCVAVLTVTGLVLAGRQVVTVDALLYTHYGQLLVAKVFIAVVAGALGARNAFVSRSLRSTDAVRRRLIWAECAGLVLVIGLAGALANGKPARGPEYTPVTTAVPAPLHAQVDDLLLGVSIRPDRPGPGFVTVSVQNTRIPVPAAIEAVTIHYTAPGDQGRSATEQAVRTDDRTWTDATDIFDEPGNWTLHVVVSRAGMPPVTLDTSWPVLAAPSSFTAHDRVSSTHLEPTLDRAALVVTAVSVLGALMMTVRASRRRRAHVGPASVEREPVSSPR